MTARLYSSRTIRLACDCLWSRAMFFGCVFGAIALGLALSDRYQLAATAGVIGAICAGVAMGALLIQRRLV